MFSNSKKSRDISLGLDDEIFSSCGIIRVTSAECKNLARYTTTKVVVSDKECRIVKYSDQYYYVPSELLIKRIKFCSIICPNIFLTDCINYKTCRKTHLFSSVLYENMGNRKRLFPDEETLNSNLDPLNEIFPIPSFSDEIAYIDYLIYHICNLIDLNVSETDRNKKNQSRAIVEIFIHRVFISKIALESNIHIKIIEKTKIIQILDKTLFFYYISMIMHYLIKLIRNKTK